MKPSRRSVTLASLIVGLIAVVTPIAAPAGPSARPRAEEGLAVTVFCIHIIREVPCGVGEVIVKRMDGIEVTRQASNKTGRFQIRLKPGKYQVSAIDALPQRVYSLEIAAKDAEHVRSVGPKQVEVEKNKFTEVRIVYWDGRKCLSSHTKISTPQGDVNVEDVKTGMLVWTLEAAGNKIAAPVLKTIATPVPRTHTMLHMIFKDGREASLSSGHPLANGRGVERLSLNALYDGATVIRIETKPYWDTRTYDLLPAGDTGVYWANGILLGSTLR